MRDSIQLTRVVSAAVIVSIIWAASTAIPAGSAHAQALDTLNPPVQVAAKTNKKRSGNSVKFVPGSQETKKERSTRLKRECQGAVNAGACAGYTR